MLLIFNLRKDFYKMCRSKFQSFAPKKTSIIMDMISSNLGYEPGFYINFL
jgi:hypothetical protein